MTGWTPSWTFDPPSAHPNPIELADGLAVLNERGGWRWKAQLERTGGCAQPIQLAGRVRTVDPTTGEVSAAYDTAGEPRGVALVACRNRRAAVCPPCAELYRGDAYQLLAGGLSGDKATRPAVFVTLTAPSFGPVHASRGGRSCRPRAGFRRCSHGWPAGCSFRHTPKDPTVGAPVCPACSDTVGIVLFNALAPALWRRTSIDIRRALARQAGIPRRQLADHVRLAYVKVAEFQRRGVLHYHLIVRLDPPDGADRLDEQFTVGMLTAAVTDGVRSSRLPLPADLPARLAVLPDGSRRPALGWGTQLHLQPITLTAAAATEAPSAPGRPSGHGRRVCGYLAKYATKACEDLGLPAHRISDQPPAGLPRHVAVLVDAAAGLAAVPGWARAAVQAHQLGYRGHFLTKSRTYSTTFAALRARRRTWTAQHGPDRHPILPAGDVLLAEWRYAGRGHRRPGDAWLAQLAADHAKANRLAARDARTSATWTTGGRHERHRSPTVARHDIRGQMLWTARARHAR